jgi:hypothetical protein
MREKHIEDQFKKAVKDIGGEAYKFESPGNNGMPDRLVVLPGGIIHFVELKKPKGGILSKLQKFQHRKLKTLGVHVYVIKNEEEIQNFITTCKLEMKLSKGGG